MRRCVGHDQSTETLLEIDLFNYAGKRTQSLTVVKDRTTIYWIHEPLHALFHSTAGVCVCLDQPTTHELLCVLSECNDITVLKSTICVRVRGFNPKPAKRPASERIVALGHRIMELVHRSAFSAMQATRANQSTLSQ